MWKTIKAFGVTLALLGWGVLISNTLFWFYPGAFLGLGVYGATQRAAQVASALPPPALSPADLNAVLLAVATIVLATVAFFISIAAFFGFAEIKSIVQRLTDEDRKALRQEFEAQANKNQTDIDELVLLAQQELVALRKEALEDLQQSSGLPDGKAADDIARAAGGEESSNI